MRARTWLMLTLGLSLIVSDVAAEYTKITPKRARGKRDLVLAAGGDVAYPDGKYNRRLEELGADLLKPVRRYFRRADLGFVNLEAPLTTREVVGAKTYQFTMPPHRLDWILANDVNLLSLANNHAYDAGRDGLRDTLAVLRRAGRGRFLRWAGASLGDPPPTRAVVFKPPGKSLRVAFLAYTRSGPQHIAVVRGRTIFEEVRAARKKADLVIVSVHHGKEYVHTPPKSTVRLYRKLVDAGANVVLGHHPHVIQGVERRGNAIIFYSLGNLSFGSRTVRHRATGAKMYGMLPLVEVKGGRLRRAEIVPLYVNNIEPMTVGEETLRATPFRPRVLEGVFADTVVNAIREWSAEIDGNDTVVHIRQGRAIIRFDGR